MTGTPRLDAPRRFHTVDHVAEICEVSAKTVRRWIAAKELIAHRLGHQWRIAEADLAAFLRLRRLD